MEAKARHEAFPYTNVRGLPQEWGRCTRVDLNAGEAEATCPYNKYSNTSAGREKGKSHSRFHLVASTEVTSMDMDTLGESQSLSVDVRH